MFALYVLAKEYRQSLIAVTNCYNVNEYPVLHISRCSMNELIWSHFMATVL